MPWVKVDDAFYDHPKVASLPPEYMLPCIGLHLLVLCYCNRNLTDGFIPAPQIDRLGGDLRQLLPQGTSEPLVNALLEVGLWEPDPDGRHGYVIHDYLDYNPSKRHAIAHRRRVASERSRAGKLGNSKRWESSSQTDRKRIANRSQKDRTHPVSSAAEGLRDDDPAQLVNDETTQAHVPVDATESQAASQKDRPVPVPVPVPLVVQEQLLRKKQTTAVLTDDGYLNTLQDNPAYEHIRVEQEFGKAREWAAVNHRLVTRRFFVNWLNRAAERQSEIHPINGHPSKPLVSDAMRAAMEPRP